MEYIRVRSVQEALELLASYGEGGRLIAGGTDLMADILDRRCTMQALIDIAGIPALRGIRKEDDALVIGSCTTHTDIAASPLVRQYAPALAEGCAAVGSLQIRNIATLGGNIVNAQPAADGAVPLAALEAVCTVESTAGAAQVPLAAMYAGFGKSTLKRVSELLTQIRINADAENESCVYCRLAQRSSLALPMLCTAVRLALEPDGTVGRACIAMAPVGIGPVRATHAEAYLAGKPLTDETAKEAGRLCLEDAAPRSSAVRGSREYRLMVLPVIVSRALAQAAQRIRAKAERR